MVNSEKHLHLKIISRVASPKADLDGDGDNDIAISAMGEEVVGAFLKTFLNNDENFVESETIATVGAYHKGNSIIRDFNNDGNT